MLEGSGNNRKDKRILATGHITVLPKKAAVER
jgi:hypothetical protein